TSIPASKARDRASASTEVLPIPAGPPTTNSRPLPRPQSPSTRPAAARTGARSRSAAPKFAVTSSGAPRGASIQHALLHLRPERTRDVNPRRRASTATSKVRENAWLQRLELPSQEDDEEREPQDVLDNPIEILDVEAQTLLGHAFTQCA